MLSLRTGMMKLVRAEIFYTGNRPNVDKGLSCGNIKNELTRSTRYKIQYISTAYVGLCIVTKAKGGYMHYSNVNKTCKSVYNVYTYQIHITQFIITYVPS